MPHRLDCEHCGARFDLPASHSRAKVRCESCGYYTPVPESMRNDAAPPPMDVAVEDEAAAIYAFDEPAPRPKATPVAKPGRKVAKARKRADPRDLRPEFIIEDDDDIGPKLLEGTQDEDDDQPYAVPGSGLKPCPHCRVELPLNATFCVHCGSEIGTLPKTRKREYQPVREEWHEGWSPLFRIQLFVGCVILDTVMFWISYFNGGSLSLMFILPQVLMQAFLIGSYDTLTLKRNLKGQSTLIRIRRIAFVKLTPVKLQWKDSTGITLFGVHDPGIFSWLTCAYLILLGILPGILFYWFIIRPEQFHVALCNVYGSTDEVIYHSKDREHAVEVAKGVADTMNLQIQFDR